MIFEILQYVNSVLNPIIYAVYHKQFRQAFAQLLFFRDDNAARARFNSSVYFHQSSTS